MPRREKELGSFIVKDFIMAGQCQAVRSGTYFRFISSSLPIGGNITVGHDETGTRQQLTTAQQSSTVTHRTNVPFTFSLDTHQAITHYI